MEINAFDTHCHPQFPQYDADRPDVIRRASEAGIGMICVGTDLQTSRAGVELASTTDGIWASVGVHPTEDRKGSYRAEDYKALIGPKVVAIGEIGLDLYRRQDVDEQEALLVQQLDLAHETQLPCIIHCRDAHARMAKLLSSMPDLHGVIHSFNGTVAEAERYIQGRWYIGLNGIITFSSAYEAMVQSLPLDRILLETDAPYLSPVPQRGKRNEPVRILDIAQKIADIRGSTQEAILAATRANTLQCFGMISIAGL